MVIEVIKPYTVKLTRVFRFDYHRGSNSLRIHKEPELMRKSCIALITLWSILLWLTSLPAQAKPLRLAAARFVDNRDGTVTDLQTGLMWAKTTGSLNGNPDPGDVLNVNNTYTWCEGTSTACTHAGDPPDGSMFSVFLGTLNHSVAVFNGETPGPVSGCFANHCDWRSPTIAELFALVDRSACSGSDLCIDPALGPTQERPYFSATTVTVESSLAMTVNFIDGTANDESKFEQEYVRAVRGVPSTPGFGLLPQRAAISRAAETLGAELSSRYRVNE
jgi:hypothetical protein